MSWSAEYVLMPSLVLIVGAFCLTVIWFHSRRRAVAMGAVACGLVAVGLIATERAIETDAEQLRRRVVEMAYHVENNSVPAVLEFLDPDAAKCRRSIQNEMPQYRFSSCNVAGFKQIEMDSNKPEEAKVVFVVTAYVDATRSAFQYKGLARREVILRFRKGPDDIWYVYDFSHYDPARPPFEFQ